MTHYFESGFFVRERAWHGLGRVLDNAPDTRTALQLAGLDWHVNLQPVYARLDDGSVNDGNTIECKDHRAMVRDVHQRDGSITSDCLGIVGTRYVPLQNDESFRWFDPLVADGSVELEAAGSVKGGRNVWILARIAGKPLQVGRMADDVASAYLLLSNSHDGTRSVTVAFTPIRVVCWNTLSAAHAQADKADKATVRKVRHTSGAGNTLASVRDTINLAQRDFSAKALLWRELASADIAPRLSHELARQVQRYARLVFGKSADVAKAKATGTVDELPEVRAEQHLWKLLHNGPGHESAGVSPFGLYMAATHYADHVNGHNNNTRLASTWFGTGPGIRDRAEQEAMALAGV